VTTERKSWPHLEQCASCTHMLGEHAATQAMKCMHPDCGCAAFVPSDPERAFEKGLRDGLRWLREREQS